LRVTRQYDKIQIDIFNVIFMMALTYYLILSFI